MRINGIENFSLSVRFFSIIIFIPNFTFFYFFALSFLSLSFSVFFSRYTFLYFSSYSFSRFFSLSRSTSPRLLHAVMTCSREIIWQSSQRWSDWLIVRFTPTLTTAKETKAAVLATRQMKRNPSSDGRWRNPFINKKSGIRWLNNNQWFHLFSSSLSYKTVNYHSTLRKIIHWQSISEPFPW